MKLLLNPKSLAFKFKVPEMEATEGVQKVMGFSRGWHHWNSIRLGIRKENDYCVLYMYAYVDGKRIIKRLGKVSIGVEVLSELRFNNGYASVDCYCGNTVVGSYTYTDVPIFTFPIGFFLYPYAEIDGPENKRTPFEVDIKNLKVNGKLIKIQENN